jgi:FkbM family methyltransferase
VPQTFAYLLANTRVNHSEDKITAMQVGVGDKPGELFFTCGSMDTVNHVVTEEEKISNVPTVKVPVLTLDKIFENNCPAIIKIDVEGFEWPVLQGAGNTIHNNNLKAVIVEINGSGERYGIPDEDIHSFFINNGFKPYQYDPFSRSITGLMHYGAYNTIYIKDPDWVKQRVATSKKYEIFGFEI